MSYKFDLTDLRRAADVSLTQQLVDRIVSAIESGALGAGDKLPPTRALAAEAGINHLTAARVYRRLAEDGYVTASVGRGTFVRAPAPAAADEPGDDWQAYVLPARTASYQEEILSDSFRFGGREDSISLATGFPGPELHPVEELAALTARVFEEEGEGAISPLMPEGLPALRQELAVLGSDRGGGPSPDELIVTSGGQQALDLAARALLGPGDVAAVESPTFTGTLMALRATGARVIGVPTDAEGLDVDALERLLARHQVRLCAVQSACQNPTGADLSPQRRARLAKLAVDRNLFVIDDRVCADLRYEGEPQPPLWSDAPGHVVEVGSFSKVVGGGLRLGWIGARGPILDRLTMLKQCGDSHTATPLQHLGARYLAAGAYDDQLARSLPLLRERRDALLDAVERELAGDCDFEAPRGGHHLWITLRRPVEERALHSEAVRQGVSFTPGGAVTVEPSRSTSLRLSFSQLDPEELDTGVKRLARALREVHRRDRSVVVAPLS